MLSSLRPSLSGAWGVAGLDAVRAHRKQLLLSVGIPLQPSLLSPPHPYSAGAG